MEESTKLKRQREEEDEATEVVKRQKSYEDILFILDDDEEEAPNDLSSLITTLQQEIVSSSDESPHIEDGETEDERERVMKHLLEASDDELGIPKTEAGDGFEGPQAQGLVSVEEIDAGDLLLQPVGGGGGFGNGLLWEIEDEAANYYTLLQSELFM